MIYIFVWVTWFGHTQGSLRGLMEWPPCHSGVEKLPIVLHLVFTVLPVTPSSTHTAQSPAFAIQSPIPIGPSCSSMTQKEVCQSATWTSPMCDFFFVSSCTEECLRVLMHFLSFFEWCHVFLFLCLFSSVLLDRLCCSSLFSSPPTPLASVFFVSSFLVSVSLFSRWFPSRAAEHLGIPVIIFFLFFPSFFLCFWLFYSNCLCWQFVFFGLSVFLEFKIGRQVCWHIFPGRHWVSRFTSEPFTMKDRGIKTAASLQTTASQMWMFLSIGDLDPVHPNLHTVLNAPLLLFMAPCSFLPLTDILSIASDPNILFIHLIYLPPPQNQLSTLPSPVFQSSVNFRLNLQTHRAVRYTGRTLTHCTSEPRP